MKSITVQCPNIGKWYEYARTHPNFQTKQKTGRQAVVVPNLSASQIRELGAVIGIKLIKKEFFKVRH